MSEDEVHAPSPLTRVARGAVIALIVELVELVVLAITGTALFFIYRPTAAQARDDIATLHHSATIDSAVRDVHRAAGRLAIWTALVAAVMVAIEPGQRVRWIRSTALGVGLLQVILSRRSPATCFRGTSSRRGR